MTKDFEVNLESSDKLTELEDARIKKIMGTIDKAFAAQHNPNHVSNVIVDRHHEVSGLCYTVEIESVKNTPIISFTELQFINDKLSEIGLRIIALRPTSSFSLQLLLVEDEEDYKK